MDKLNKARELAEKYIQQISKDSLNEKFKKYNSTPNNTGSVLNYFSSIHNEYSFFDTNTIQEKIQIENHLEPTEKWTEIIFSHELMETLKSVEANTDIKVKEETSFETPNNNFASAA